MALYWIRNGFNDLPGCAGLMSKFRPLTWWRKAQDQQHGKRHGRRHYPRLMGQQGELTQGPRNVFQLQPPRLPARPVWFVHRSQQPIPLHLSVVISTPWIVEVAHSTCCKLVCEFGCVSLARVSTPHGWMNAISALTCSCFKSPSDSAPILLHDVGPVLSMALRFCRALDREGRARSALP